MSEEPASGQHWTGLVIRPDDWLDNDLLAAIALATGSTFERIGHTGLGLVFAAGTEQIIEVECSGAKALFLRTRSRERSAAIIESIGRHTLTWTESVLRNQLVLETEPYGLVPLLMATGGAPPEPGTADLLRRAVEHPDAQVREAAGYAIRMSKAWTSFFVVS
ncbi:hypothetical protein [Kribbella sp.]|uniref:hypothetical protein n=1 Tax=Kribbella sp. TaxID=1871183 RepID=UPI002D26899B|nr:hypothetical protein [Kribbella sp.]HZX05494.1 hypothetical protein [Kribbella sp.]